MKIGVAGAGLMGAGITQAAAQAGHDVRLIDLSEDLNPGDPLLRLRRIGT